jgi:hypothetical protein
MTDRRHFLKTLAGVPPLLALDPVWAAPDPSRIALIIGNSAYPQSPLENPANDASAMRDLFVTAGFTTDSQLNATRNNLITAIDNFTTRAQSAETKLAVFYYAGHGAQLDWRNYLLPVDIAVKTPDDVKSQCVDLGRLLGKLTKTGDKTFIIILDACRDDPFKGSYRPQQKGLSQFDAPVGSLLAYATSPGNVASDGGGKNGLYTENLVRELSNRSAKIEDALKRVRLNVRLSSNGEQIPWETTSLESDVFIFPGEQKKLSETEIEKLIEAEMETWGKLKASKKLDDWVGYLKQYPNGRFAEIAQNRLTHLLAESRKIVPVAAPASSPAPVTAATAITVRRPPDLILKPGGDMSLLIQPSANPNSAGRFPLGKRVSVGDTGEYRHVDMLTGVEERTTILVVTLVDEETGRFEANGGKWVFDLMSNVLETPFTGKSNVPQQIHPAELQVGVKWTAAWTQDNPRFGEQFISMDFRVTAFETVEVPAGKFQAFRIEGYGWIRNQSIELETRRWVVPGLNFSVKQEHINRRQGRMTRTERLELVSTVQHRFGADCTATTTDSGPGKTRSLIIKNSCSA